MEAQPSMELKRDSSVEAQPFMRLICVWVYDHIRFGSRIRARQAMHVEG